MLATVASEVAEKRRADAELDADLLTMNVNKVCLGEIPSDFVSFILERPGDFCISTNALNSYVFSIKSDEHKTFHLTLEKLRKGYRIRGMLFATGATIGELIYNIRDSSLDVLSGVLRCRAYPRRLITKEVLPCFRIYSDECIISKRLSYEDVDFRYFRGNIFINQEFTDVILKENKRLTDANWKMHMYDELRVSYLAKELHLPVRIIIGLIRANNGYIIYDSNPGCDFARFMEENGDRMDCGLKIKLCRALASVMSGLFNADIYCGAVKMENFHVYYVVRKLHILAPIQLRPVESGDFTRMAPEVTWTRILTPEAGVYSMGLVLRAVLESGVRPSSKDPNFEMLTRVEALIQKCTHSKPSERPSVHGIFIELDAITKHLKQTKYQFWQPL
ncbi:hypothetical protein Y032_0303g1899 [Ancylostoma ceylanicum]|uniref:Protein kinase domain-containing protein n=1 Tax=Ancylostoma ceylanicum TaxID=53326 RepID=A0A016S3Z3_9BILA|nr:hypothetical protein Y032_0303g1899 [Ancylostoma ceylanicum]